MIPFRTVKAACSAAISDRKVPSSAKADSMSIGDAGEPGSCLTDVDEFKAEGRLAARADMLATATLGSAQCYQLVSLQPLHLL